RKQGGDYHVFGARLAKAGDSSHKGPPDRRWRSGGLFRASVMFFRNSGAVCASVHCRCSGGWRIVLKRGPGSWRITPASQSWPEKVYSNIKESQIMAKLPKLNPPAMPVG